jgi:hypothetical protein
MNRSVAFLMTVLLALLCSQLPGQTGGAKNNRNSDPELSGSYLFLAGYYRSDLKLTDRQMDSVKVHTRRASKMAGKADTVDVAGYERAVLRRILSEGQFEDLIVYRNMPVSKLLGQKVWNEMVSLHYVSRADSARLYTQIRMYLHTVLVARDYYADYPELQTKYLEELSEKAPASLYRYYHNGKPKPAAVNYYRSEFIY